MYRLKSYPRKQAVRNSCHPDTRKILVLFLTIFAFFSHSAANAEEIGTKYSSKDYELTVFYQSEANISESLLTSIQDLYFECYPAMRETYGTAADRSVTIFLEESSGGAADPTASTTGTEIHCSRQFLEESDGNKNTLVHELFHVVQNGYPGSEEDPLIPVLCEGLADCARADCGFYPETDWELPGYSPEQSYMDSYRVTAAFLSWIADTYDRNFPIRLNQVLHEGSYTAEFWKNAVGYGIDDLWEQYASSSES